MRNALWIGGGITGMGEIPIIGARLKGLVAMLRKIYYGSTDGIWYDYNDMSTLYQDAAGTIPVTGSGQPVGLVLDKSKELVLGSNLIPNGSFSSDTSWNKGPGWTIADGVARFDGSTNFSNLGNITPSSINGKWLRVELDLSNVGSSVTQVRVLVSGALAATIPVSGAGKYSAMVLGGSVTSIGIQSQGVSGANYAFTLDNVSVKEAFGNHAYQTTSASRPIFRQVPILGNELGINGDFSNGISGWSANNATIEVQSGQLKVTATITGDSRARQIITGLTTGRFYTVTGKFQPSTACRVRVNSVVANTAYSSGNSYQSFTLVFLATSSSATVDLELASATAWMPSGSFAYFDNISVKEITGYRTDQNYLEYDGVDDKLITTVSPAINNATVLTALVGSGTKVESGKYLTGNYEQTVSNAGVTILNRSLTRSERIAIDAGLTKITGVESLDSFMYKQVEDITPAFYFDPNDLTTLYQDAAGTIPVTAAGQPVGLVLDKSKGLVLGIEKVSNNDFSNKGVGWIIGGGVPAYAGGVVTLTTPAGGTGEIYQDISVPAGRWVKITASAKYSNALSFGLNVYEGGGYTSYKGVIVFGTSFEEKSGYFFSTTGSLRVRMRLGTGTVAGTGDVDYISVKEIAGNHAYQTVSASRPILTNRVNLFNDSENFSTWVRNDGIALATPNPKYPNAVKLSRVASTVYIHRSGVTVAGTYTLTGLFKNVVGNVSAIIANNETVVMSKVGTTSEGFDIYQATQTIPSILNSSVTGILLLNDSSSVEVYGLDVRQTQQSTSLPPYQKVVGGTQFDSIGFPNYLLFDGVDDFLQTNSIDFTSTDKVSLFAGVRKLSDASQGMIAELSSGNAIGSFMFHCGGGIGSEAYTFGSRGSSTGYSYSLLTKSSYPLLAAPKSNVITSKGAISTDLSKIKVDRTYSSSNSIIDQGTGNYGNYPLYIGRRGGVSLPFNGHLYNLIGIGRLTTDSETITIEKELAKRTGVTLSV